MQFLLILSSATSAVAADVFLVSAEDIVLPLYANGRPRAIGVCRARRVFEDYQRKGFFRIGLLPSAGIEDMVLEVRDASLLPKVLEKASVFFGHASGSKPVMDVRGFRLFFPSQSNFWVHAERMQVENPAVWQLRTVTFGAPNAPARSFRRATLLVKGARTGELYCDSAEQKISIHLPSMISETSAP